MCAEYKDPLQSQWSLQGFLFCFYALTKKKKGALILNMTVTKIMHVQAENHTKNVHIKGSETVQLTAGDAEWSGLSK